MCQQMELFKAFVTRPAIVTDGEVKPMSAPDADLMGMIFAAHQQGHVQCVIMFFLYLEVNTAEVIQKGGKKVTQCGRLGLTFTPIC